MSEKRETISELVLDIVEPLLVDQNDDDEIRAIIQMGISAWNAAVMKITDGKEKVAKLLNNSKRLMQEWEFEELLATIKLKEELYPNNLSLITDFDLVFNNDNTYKLTVETLNK